MSTTASAAADTSDPEVQKLYNIPIIGNLFKPNKNKKKSILQGLTGIDMIDNFLVPLEEEDTSKKYYNSPEFDYGETVNEKISGMPVIDAYITLICSLLLLAFIIFLIGFTIYKLT
jgi:hypothetical protein